MPRAPMPPVCVFQQMEILAFTVPAVAALQSTEPLNVLDLGAALWSLILVAWEAVADYQMLCFQVRPVTLTLYLTLNLTSTLTPTLAPTLTLVLALALALALAQ